MLGVAVVLVLAIWAWLRFTYVGKALRAAAEAPDIAAAFGVHDRRLALLLAGVSAATAGIAGTFVAFISTLAPSQIYAWIGVVFAAVIMGGLGNPVGHPRREPAHRRQRGDHPGGDGAVLGAAWCRSPC